MKCQLPAQLKHLCGKIALERSRPIAWQEAASLRAQVQRLKQGQHITTVEKWLKEELSKALVAQAGVT